MDPETLFDLYVKMSGHLDVINRELGMVIARLDWVEWWVKIIVVPLTSLNTLASAILVISQRRNNNREK